jgi:hypothetical protein
MAHQSFPVEPERSLDTAEGEISVKNEKDDVPNKAITPL